MAVLDASELPPLSSYYSASPLSAHIFQPSSRTLDHVVDVAFGCEKECSASLNRKVCLWSGDITTLRIDAIVNAARPSLLGGGGIDKAIHDGAGPQLRNECAGLGGCWHGECKATAAYNLPCDWVLHTVGPHRDLHSEEQRRPLLRASYESCLNLCESLEIRSIALPCISTGAYRYPIREATHIALRTVREWLDTHPDSLDRLVFVIFLKEDFLVYQELLPLYFPPYACMPKHQKKVSQDLALSNMIEEPENGEEEADAGVRIFSGLRLRKKRAC